MPDTDSSEPTTPQNAAEFATTHWTLVLAAGSPDSSRYREALETLCRSYWYPLYAYLRRRGYERHTAEDYTQAFFMRLLEKESLRQIDPTLGKFRSFLLAALKHFIADELGRARAQKRGGNWKALPLDFTDAETQYTLEPFDHLSPEAVFEKSWALSVLERTMSRLKAENIDANKAHLFEYLKAYLTGIGDSVSYQQAAAELDMTEGAVKVAVHRMRKRYGQLLWDEIAQTVTSKEEVEQEIRDLLAVLAR